MMTTSTIMVIMTVMIIYTVSILLLTVYIKNDKETNRPTVE